MKSYDLTIQIKTPQSSNCTFSTCTYSCSPINNIITIVLQYCTIWNFFGSFLVL